MSSEATIIGGPEAIGVASFVFCPIERNIGLQGQIVLVAPVIGIDSNADARANTHLVTSNHHVPADFSDEAVGSPTGRFAVYRINHQDGEFVATPARDNIGSATVLPEDFGHSLKYGIPDLMPEVVIDRLELVEIDQQERQPAAIACRTLEMVIKHLVELGAVSQPGQVVGHRQAEHLCLRFVPLGHILHRAIRSNHVAMGIAHVHATPMHPPHLAVIRPDDAMLEIERLRAP